MSRVDLARMFKELGFNAGAEIGTASGNFAYSLAAQNHNAKLYCVDPYEAYDGYGDIDEAKMFRNFMKAQERLRPFENVEFIKKYSKEAVQLFEDCELDYVYIDANHSFGYVLEDIVAWSYKVRSGGIISGHDYSLVGVRDAVNMLAPPEWYLLNDNETWYWVRQ